MQASKQNNTLSDWIKAENSFLNMFSTIGSKDSCIEYSWNIGQQWSKFNFLRASGDLSLDENLESLKAYIRKNDMEGKKSFVKSSLLLDREFSDSSINFKLVGTPISHNSNLSTGFIIKEDTESVLVKVTSIDLFKQWWIVNSNGRNRENPFESVIYKQLLRHIFEKQHELFLLKYKNEFVTCVAFSKFEAGYNCWGLATVEKYQRMGFSKSIYSKFVSKLSEEINLFGQNNLSSAFLKYRQKHNSFKGHIVESCFEANLVV